MSLIGGANPPSSPILTASFPYFSEITFFNVWYVSAHILMASAILSAPTGIIMNSWKSKAFPACSPPFKTFIIGVGIT